MYQIRLLNQAKKDLKRVDKRFLTKIYSSTEELSSNPFLGKKMLGKYQGFYRIKIPPIRIVYKIDNTDKIIWIHAIGQRQGVYN